MPPKGSKRKSNVADSGTSTPQVPTLAERLSYAHIPRPFKNPAYSKNANRRSKSVKQILNADRERERVDREKRKAEREAAMDIDEGGEGAGVGTGAGAEGSFEDILSYLSIEAAPSVMPQRRYCDVTGLEAPYKDPRTGLRFHDKTIYELIKNLNPAATQAYLAVRGQSSIVK
ncbi:hypothetical protein BOTBODRAFT_38286 [Botryobasidium botryosum FD-172 SS1]|uniref:Vps72/YL1 C-terminal domain-containing protein n=1 Tax=Botryobasidium botryosum (strain FD-172 SS1) TaxID=930990 RepID=A0A067M070_BOTB1|nr:hypothetical protein BOTBODRAFT_38286 [Botryobasidium botryosum FD-172 SS1]